MKKSTAPEAMLLCTRGWFPFEKEGKEALKNFVGFRPRGAGGNPGAAVKAEAADETKLLTEASVPRHCAHLLK